MRRPLRLSMSVGVVADAQLNAGPERGHRAEPGVGLAGGDAVLDDDAGIVTALTRTSPSVTPPPAISTVVPFVMPVRTVRPRMPTPS